MHRVGGKILDNDFNTLMMNWCTSLGTAKFMSFISGGIATRGRIIPNALIEFIATNTWTAKMSVELCSRVKPKQETQIDAMVWYEVHADMDAKRKREEKTPTETTKVSTKTKTKTTTKTKTKTETKAKTKTTKTTTETKTKTKKYKDKDKDKN